MFPVQKDLEIIEDQLDGIRCVRIQASSAPKHTIFYLHGGAYFMALEDIHVSILHFAGELARRCDAQVWVVDYRVAPENPYPAAIDDTYKAFMGLGSKGIDAQNVIVGGDSAGGGLTLALLMKLRDNAQTLPKAAIAISPWSDLAATGLSRIEREDLDPMLSSKGEVEAISFIVGQDHVRDPYISPYYGTYEGLPPLLILVGGREVLFDDSARVAEKAKQAGIEVELDVNEGMFHVYPVFSPILKESEKAIERIAKFIKRQFK
jgi:acetyl esterase/lipase